MFVQVLGDLCVFSYWIDTLVLKTEGNTCATLLHHPFLFKGKPTHAQEVARRIFGTVAGEIYAKSRHTKYPSQLLSLTLHYLPFASHFPLPHFTKFVVLFASFSFVVSCRVCFCVQPCLLLLWIVLPLLCALSRTRFSTLNKGEEKI